MSHRILCFPSAAKIDRRSRFIPQLDMPREEVRMEMREEDVPDAVAAFRGVLQVLFDVALRIDNGSSFRLLVRDHVGHVRKTTEVVLLHLHVLRLPEVRRICGL